MATKEELACRLARLWAVRVVFICVSSEGYRLGVVERRHAKSLKWCRGR